MFAAEKIENGEVVVVKAGHIVTAEQLAQITPAVGDYALQIHDRFYFVPCLQGRTGPDVDIYKPFLLIPMSGSTVKSPISPCVP